MILVFGGTTEGRKVANMLDTVALPYFYSTKTNVAFTGKGTPIYGEMTTELLEAFCREHKITHIINASHPFAVQLHQMVANIALDILVLRFQRKFLPRTSHPLVFYVDSFEEALEFFKTNKYQSLLALSGVQTITKLKSYWQMYTAWFRILDRDSSRAIAAQSNFPVTNLIFGYPQSKTEEIELFRQIAPQVVFTKESGSNGKLEEKIQAALELDLPIVILKKPELSNRYIRLETEEELVERVTK